MWEKVSLAAEDELEGTIGVGVGVATGVLVGTMGVEVGLNAVGDGVEEEARVGVGTAYLVPPRKKAVVGVGTNVRVTGTTRLGVGAKNRVGLRMGVGATVIAALVGIANRVGVGRTARVAVGEATRVVAADAN